MELTNKEVCWLLSVIEGRDRVHLFPGPTDRLNQIMTLLRSASSTVLIKDLDATRLPEA